MKGLRMFLAIALALSGVILPLWLMRHGINFQDEPYQMLNAAEHLASPLAPLSAWAGHVWSGIFGFNLLAFRAFSLICMWLSVAVPAFYFYRRTRRADISLALFGIVASWLAMIPAKGYLYGWDNLSTLALVSLLTLTVSYIRHPRASTALLCGILLAILTLSRIPNLVYSLLLFPIIIACAPKGKRGLSVLIAAVAFAGFALAFICLAYGSPEFYIASFRENIISGHGISYLIEGYERTGTALLRFSAFALAIVLALRVRSGIFSTAVVAVFVIFGCRLPSYPLAATANFLSAGLLVAALVTASVKTPVRVAVTATALCATIGSDMGFDKLITLQGVILICALCNAEQRKRLLQAIVVMWAVVMWVEMPAQAHRGFEDEGFCRTTVPVSSTPFAGIRTTPKRAEEIVRTDSIIRDWKNRGGEVLIVGDCFRYAADLISGEPRPASTRHAYLIDYSTYSAEVTRLIADRREKPLMIITPRPFDWRYPDIPASARIPALEKCDTFNTPGFSFFYYSKVSGEQ